MEFCYRTELIGVTLLKLQVYYKKILLNNYAFIHRYKEYLVNGISTQGNNGQIFPVI